MKLLIRQQLLLLIAALIVFFTGLSGYGLFNDGEATTAGSVAEMSAYGAWVLPTFNQVPKTDQSILAYWFTLISFHFLGTHEYAARLTSSILAVGTTLLTYHLGRKLYSPAIGFLAGIIVCTSLAMSAFGRAATPDSTQVFFETLALTYYVWILAWQRGGTFDTLPSMTDEVDDAEDMADPVELKEIKESPPKENSQIKPAVDANLKWLVPSCWQLAAPMYVALGLAVLATGFAGFGLPYGTIFLFVLITWRNQELIQGSSKAPSGGWFRRHILTVGQLMSPLRIVGASRGLNFLIGIGIVAAIAAPWYLSVGLITRGAWWREFFWDQNFNRVVGLRGTLVWLPVNVIYYPFIILGSLIPWAVFLPVAMYQLWLRLDDDDEQWPLSDRLLACWVGVWCVDFLLFGTDLPNSVLPICPALALILARYLYDWEHEQGDWGVYSFNLCCKALGIVGLVMILGFYITAYVCFPGDEWLGLIGLVPSLGAFVAIKLLDRDYRRRVMQTLVVTAVLMTVLIVGLAPSSIGPYQDSPLFVADARRFAGTKDVEIATYDSFEPSIVFYAGKKVRRLSTPRQVADFIVNRPRQAFVITKASKYNELRDELPSNVTELSRHRNFLWRTELILLGEM